MAKIRESTTNLKKITKFALSIYDVTYAYKSSHETHDITCTAMCTQQHC